MTFFAPKFLKAHNSGFPHCKRTCVHADMKAEKIVLPICQNRTTKRNLHRTYFSSYKAIPRGKINTLNTWGDAPNHIVARSVEQTNYEKINFNAIRIRAHHRWQWIKKKKSREVVCSEYAKLLNPANAGGLASIAGFFTKSQCRVFPCFKQAAHIMTTTFVNRVTCTF